MSELGVVFVYGSMVLPPPDFPLTRARTSVRGPSRWNLLGIRALDGHGSRISRWRTRRQERDADELRRSIPIFYLQRGNADGVADVIAPPNVRADGATPWNLAPFGHPLILGEQSSRR